jgi:hypothetical protein
MKVLDLACSSEHRFEGWFASEEAFQQQLELHQLECPICGTTDITKRLSAPRLNLAPRRSDPTVPDVTGATAAPEPGLAQGEQLRALRQWVASTEDVGDQFPEEARKIHYGEAQERSIRGQATMAQTRELLEEGIAVMPLALPRALKAPLH